MKGGFWKSKNKFKNKGSFTPSSVKDPHMKIHGTIKTNKNYHWEPTHLKINTNTPKHMHYEINNTYKFESPVDIHPHNTIPKPIKPLFPAKVQLPYKQLSEENNSAVKRIQAQISQQIPLKTSSNKLVNALMEKATELKIKDNPEYSNVSHLLSGTKYTSTASPQSIVNQIAMRAKQFKPNMYKETTN